MSAEITVADFLWGPIALIINFMKHGYPPSSMQGGKELLVSGMGTAFWISALGAIGRIR